MLTGALTTQARSPVRLPTSDHPRPSSPLCLQPGRLCPRPQAAWRAQASPGQGMTHEALKLIVELVALGGCEQAFAARALWLSDLPARWLSGAQRFVS